MAKYSKAAAKSVESAVKRMKKGTLTSGKSEKKVTSKKQAVAIGLSEAREKGAKVPAKKAAGKKAAAKKTAAKKAAPKKPARPAGAAAAKKKGAPQKKTAAKKTAAKKSQGTSSNKAPTKKPGRSAGGALPKTAAAEKSTVLKPAAKKASKKSTPAKTVPKKITTEKPSKAKAKMPGETSDTGEFISTPDSNDNETVTNADVNNIVTPEAESDNAVFAATVPDQQYMPEDFRASVQDPYHGNVNPSKAKTSVKPSGKKPLWDNRK